MKLQISTYNCSTTNSYYSEWNTNSDTINFLNQAIGANWFGTSTQVLNLTAKWYNNWLENRIANRNSTWTGAAQLEALFDLVARNNNTKWLSLSSFEQNLRTNYPKNSLSGNSTILIPDWNTFLTYVSTLTSYDQLQYSYVPPVINTTLSIVNTLSTYTYTTVATISSVNNSGVWTYQNVTLSTVLSSVSGN